MTYMPSTQSGVSDSDQSPEISQAFLHDEAKAKKHMKKLAKMLKRDVYLSYRKCVKYGVVTTV
jgi:ATP-dependent protease ClpP protease subunit